MQTPKVTHYCRWAPSLGALEASHQSVWGTEEYGTVNIEARNKPTVFFGLYGFRDFQVLWNHQGKRYILWAGSDIQHFLKGYWLDEIGNLRIDPRVLAPWIATYCESYVENEIEEAALASVGIVAKVVPSFLGDVHISTSYQHSDRPKLYTSVSGDNFELYGWDLIPGLAELYPDIEFHLYGHTTHPFTKQVTPNIFFHGRVPKEQMNEEIKDMQGALRLTRFDGFSEILAKSVLMGQWPVSLIEYSHMLKVTELNRLKELKEPNLAGRSYYQGILNKYPWNQNA